MQKHTADRKELLAQYDKTVSDACGFLGIPVTNDLAVVMTAINEKCPTMQLSVNPAEATDAQHAQFTAHYKLNLLSDLLRVASEIIVSGSPLQDLIADAGGLDVVNAGLIVVDAGYHLLTLGDTTPPEAAV